MDLQKQAALAAIDAVASELCALSDAIWDQPELGFQEFHAARLQCDMLKSLGFQVEEQLAGIPTAFSGTWGSGRPVIGFMGEFDALPGLSQQDGGCAHAPIVPGASGQGCGHHLLGTGALAAAYACKEYLRTTGKPGTVIYYGCPAEEGGSGKTFMARDGVFNHLDCAFYWHPGAVNRVGSSTTLANYMVRYHFKGISAHASSAPHMGRSALDAMELMNTGAQYLREHLPRQVSFAYAVIDAGGISPGVVQANAQVKYIIRGPNIPEVQQAFERLNKVARGAAMMTETEVDIQFEKACSEQLIMQGMNDVLQANLEQIPLPEYTQEDLDFAQAIRESTGRPIKPGSSPLVRRVTPRKYEVTLDYCSGDLGDVSHICPTGEIMAATWAVGTPGHSWQVVTQGKRPTAHKGMLYAGKVLAGGAIDLINDPDKLAEIRAEHAAVMAEAPYVCPIPKDTPLPAI